MAIIFLLSYGDAMQDDSYVWHLIGKMGHEKWSDPAEVNAGYWAH